MKLFYWNCRGIGNPDSQRYLYNVCVSNRLDFLCLSEPFVDFASVSFRFWDSLGLQLLATNQRDPPTLWVFKNKLFAAAPTGLVCGEQHVSFTLSVNNQVFKVSFVYASVWRNRRLQLWEELMVFSDTSLPWMVIGDFNVLQGAHEKTGRPPASLPCREFNRFIESADLLHVPHHGVRYTWCNGRRGAARVESLLDRTLVNALFLSAWARISCVALTRHNSDHSPLLLACDRLSSPPLSGLDFFGCGYLMLV